MLASILSRQYGLDTAGMPVTVEEDIRIPVAMGVTLATDHYQPEAPGDYPTILIRTPYGMRSDLPVGIINNATARIIASHGYHVILQSVRGRFGSDGEFIPYQYESRDGAATVSWIHGQDWFNGKLGLYGISYPGYCQWAVVTKMPDRVHAMVPSFTASTFRPSRRPSGDAFALAGATSWLLTVDGLDGPTKRGFVNRIRRAIPHLQKSFLAKAVKSLPLEGVDEQAVGYTVPWFRDWMRHDDPARDPVWGPSDHSDRVREVTAPAHFIGGWYDTFLNQQVRDFTILQAEGRNPYLTIGPWTHLTADGGLEMREALVWFDHHLKGYLPPRRDPVRLYVMGLERWETFTEWPPVGHNQRYYLQAGGVLTHVQPAAGALPVTYTFDPADPTPSLGGAYLSPGAGRVDNRSLEARADVLTFTTPPLEKPLTVIGVPVAELTVSSSRPFTDFFVRMCDVAPDGTSTNLADGMFRVSPAKVTPSVEGLLRLEFELWPTAITFKPGHSIRVQVCSGAYPRVSINPGTGEPLLTAVEMQPAVQTIYLDAERPSAIRLPVVEMLL